MNGSSLWRNISGAGEKWQWKDGGIRYVDMKAIGIGWSLFLAKNQERFGKFGTKLVYEMTARETEQWMFKSQPIFDMVHTSALQSSKSSFVYLYTAFTSQVNQIWNMLWSATVNSRRMWHEASNIENESRRLSGAEAAKMRTQANSLRQAAIGRVSLTYSLVGINMILIRMLRQAGSFLYMGPRPPADDEGALGLALDFLEDALGFVIVAGPPLASFISHARSQGRRPLRSKDILQTTQEDIAKTLTGTGKIIYPWIK